MTKFSALAFIQNEEGKILGVNGRYGLGLPGGKAEEGEMPLDTLKRELREETGLSFLKATPIYSRMATNYFVLTFLCEGIYGLLDPEQGSEVGWYLAEDFHGPIARYPEYNRSVLQSVSRRIVIVGPTKSGKTTAAEMISETLQCPVISAGGWIREKYPKTSSKILGTKSVDILKKTPSYALDWIRGQLTYGPKYVVIEGVRNPWDFADLCRPNYDVVIRLKRCNESHASKFELEGIAAIDEMLHFGENVGLNVLEMESKTVQEMCSVVLDFLKKAE